jgi:hypothetical protein
MTYSDAQYTKPLWRRKYGMLALWKAMGIASCAGLLDIAKPRVLFWQSSGAEPLGRSKFSKGAFASFERGVCQIFAHNEERSGPRSKTKDLAQVKPTVNPSGVRGGL